MTRPRILNLEESYNFSRYFELPYTTADILADLGFGFSRSRPSICLTTPVISAV
jgi:hypothetical protein